MTTKSFEAGDALRITPKMERNVRRAFDEFARTPQAPRMFNGQLVRFMDTASCLHAWCPVRDMPKEHADYLQSITEEETPPTGVMYCEDCGAVCYRENGGIWLYDATARFHGRPPKHHTQNQRRDR